MLRVAVLSCTKVKAATPVPIPARDLYWPSTLFRLSYEYARMRRAHLILILSAKYGLLEQEDLVSTYEQSLQSLTRLERDRWTGKVQERLCEIVDVKRTQFLVLASAGYTSTLQPTLLQAEFPMQGLGIGKRLQFLSQALRGRSAELGEPPTPL